MASKASCQQRHFKRRMLQRYDIDITKRTYRQLVERARTEDCIVLERQSNRVRKILLDIEGHMIPVIYDRKRKTLTTALP